MSEMRRLMTLVEAGTTPPETPWDELTTGQPAMFYAWRGVGGSSTPLSDRWKAKLGRDYLLGDGIYVAPTRHMAARFGEPKQCRVVVWNPYVMPHANGSDLIGLDLDAIRREHDAFVILSGRGAGNEDIRQACIWPEHPTARVEVGIAPPSISTLQAGAKVRIIDNFVNDYEREKYGPLVGQVGKVTSMTLGHPNVRIKGKTYFISKQNVEVIP